LLNADSPGEDLLIHQTIRNLMEKFQKILYCDRCTIFFLDDDENELYFYLDTKCIRFSMNEGIAGAAARNRSGEIVNEVYKDIRFNRSVDRQTGYRTRNILCEPVLTREGKVIAVIQMVNKFGAHGFNIKDQLLLKSCAAKISPGLLAIQSLNKQIDCAGDVNWNNVREEDARVSDNNSIGVFLDEEMGETVYATNFKSRRSSSEIKQELEMLEIVVSSLRTDQNISQPKPTSQE